jgi:hypothetical protein
MTMAFYSPCEERNSNEHTVVKATINKQINSFWTIVSSIELDFVPIISEASTCKVTKIQATAAARVRRRRSHRR